MQIPHLLNPKVAHYDTKNNALGYFILISL